MIRVTIEILPHGLEAEKSTIASASIVLTAGARETFSIYDVSLEERTRINPSWPVRSDEFTWSAQTVVAHRYEQGAVALVAEALNAALRLRHKP